MGSVSGKASFQPGALIETLLRMGLAAPSASIRQGVVSTQEGMDWTRLCAVSHRCRIAPVIYLSLRSASLPVPTGDRFQWEADSTYIRRPPFFRGLAATPDPLKEITGARVLGVFGDSITTDHISPAGFWLRFRGHLDKISDNMFLGAVNAFTGERGKAIQLLTGERGVEVPKVARAYQGRGVRFLGVNVKDERRSATAYARELAIPYPSLFDPQAVNATRLGVIGLPTTFILDRDGMIGYQLTGKATVPDLSARLDGLLARGGRWAA